MNRPYVPKLGDDAAALLAGLHEVDQVKSFTNLGAAGLKFSLLSFAHFDLDRDGANNVMEAERKRTLDPKVSGTAGITRRGCAKHACTAL